MDVATAMKALEMVASGNRPFHVQLTGGEPLLEAELVLTILDRIRREGWSATTALQTNGLLLNRDCARRLKSFGTAVGVSVDGLPGMQERLRGGSTETYRAMRVLDSEQVPFSVTTVLTSLNTAELSGFAMALNSWPMASAIGLDLLVRKGSAVSGVTGMVPPDVVMLRQGITTLLEVLDFLNRHRRPPIVLREKQLLLGSLKRGVAAPYCQACTGSSIAVTPGGELFPCTQTMGDRNFLLGTLDNPHLSDTVLLDRCLPECEACLECDLRGRCPGDCPSRLHYNGKEGGDLVCAMYRAIYDYCINKGEIPS